MKNSLKWAALLMLASASTAQAGEACRDAKDMVRMANAFYAADARRVNIIKPGVVMTFSGINGHAVPSQMLYRHEGQQIYMDINAQGLLQDVEKMAAVSKDGELCRVVDGEIPEETEEDTTSVNVEFDFIFRRQDGVFPVDELVEGLKDGSKVMDGVAPAGLGFAVPDLKALILKPDTSDTPAPKAVFTRDGKAVDVPVSVFDGAQYYRLKDIRSSRADLMTVTGSYILDAGFKFDPEDIAKAEARRLSEAAEE